MIFSFNGSDARTVNFKIADEKFRNFDHDNSTVVPEATRLLNPAGQSPAKRVWGQKWAKPAKGRTRVASGGEPQRSRYVWYRFCTWSLIGYSKTCFFQRPQLVRRGHVKWTGFFSKTEWCLVEKKCVQRRDFIEGENLYSVSSKFEKQQERAFWTFMSRKDVFANWSELGLENIWFFNAVAAGNDACTQSARNPVVANSNEFWNTSYPTFSVRCVPTAYRFKAPFTAR